MDNFRSLVNLSLVHKWQKALPVLQSLGIKSPSGVLAFTPHTLQTSLGDKAAATDVINSCAEFCRDNCLTPAVPVVTDQPVNLQIARRPDFPSLNPTSRGSFQKAIANTSNALDRHQALANLQKDEHAASSKKPRLALWNTWCKFAATWGLPPCPMTPDLVRAVGASLKAGGYRSPEAYFSRAKQEHMLMTDSYPSAATDIAIRAAVRSITRGIGQSQAKDGFPLELLGPLNIQARNPISMQLSDNNWWIPMCILGGWYLTRGIELAAAEAGHLIINNQDKTVTFFLPVSKTDTSAFGAHRSHGCCCAALHQQSNTSGTLYHPMCPFHVAVDHIRALNTTFGESYMEPDRHNPLFPKVVTAPASSTGQHVVRHLNKNEVIEAIRHCVALTGEHLTAPAVRGTRQRFSEHSLRVAGAQMLARAGIDTVTIMLLGRWGSSAVRRYIQEAPLLRTSLIAIQVLNTTTLPSTPPEPSEAPSNKPTSKDTKPLMILNRKSMTCHISSTDECNIENLYWTTLCGWRYGIATFTRVTVEPVNASTCLRCSRLSASHPVLDESTCHLLSSPDRSPSASENGDATDSD